MELIGIYFKYMQKYRLFSLCVLLILAIVLNAAYDPLAGAGGGGNVHTASNNNYSVSLTNANFQGFVNLANSSPTGGLLFRGGGLWLHNSGSTSNIWIGFSSGTTNSPNSSRSSIGIGTGSLRNSTNGLQNTVIGLHSATNLLSARFTTIIGGDTGNSIVTTSGDFITSVGYGGIQSPATGSSAFGYTAGASAVSANARGVFIGFGTGPAGGGASLIMIGDNTTGTPGAESIQIGHNLFNSGTTNSIQLGNGMTFAAHNAMVFGNSVNNAGFRTNSPAAVVHNNGTSILGTQGTLFNSIMSATAVLNFDNSLAVIGAQQALTVTVTGANTNDVVMMGPPIDFSTAQADSEWNWHVSAPDTVTITRTALVASSAYTNKTWRVSVIDY